MMSSSLGVDAQGLGDQPAEPEGVRGGLALGHVQAEDPLLAERGHAQRGDDAGVDAAGQRDDDAAPLRPGEVVGQVRRGSGPSLLGVDLQALRAERLRSAVMSSHAPLRQSTRSTATDGSGSARSGAPGCLRRDEALVDELGGDDRENAHVVGVAHAAHRRDRAHLANSPATMRGLEDPGSARAPARTSPRRTSRALASAKKLAASGARYGCLGRWRIVLGHEVGEGPLEQVLLLEPEQLVPSRAVALAKSTTSRSRNGKRPSTELAMSIRSPWEARM